LTRVKQFSIALTSEDSLDVTLSLEGNEVIKFALNYRSKIDGTWHEIYRVDNAHGFLHEQKFWRGWEPLRLKSHGERSLNSVIVEYKKRVESNFERYKNYYDLLPTLKGWGFLREGHAVMLLLPFNVGNQGVEVIVADGNGEPARRPEMAPGIA